MISGDKNILTEGSEAHARFELQKGVVGRLDAFIWPQATLRRARRGAHTLREIFQAAAINHYDVITAQDPFWRGLLAYRIARRTGAKLNLQVHTDLSAQPFLRRILANFLLRRADTVRVVSDKIKAYLAPLSLKAKIAVLPIFVDLAPFRGLVHRPHPRFKKTILWVGRFEPEKDPLAALSVLADVRKSGVDAGLIMLGAGRLEGKLRSEAERLIAYVEFPGWQNPVPYLQVADVVVSTSVHESYGASILEALAAGVPVVAPDIGIAKEAGAIVVARTELATAVCDALQEGKRGELLMSLPSRDEWAKRWRESLI